MIAEKRGLFFSDTSRALDFSPAFSVSEMSSYDSVITTMTLQVCTSMLPPASMVISADSVVLSADSTLVAV